MLAYFSNGYIYFSRGNLVYRSVKKFILKATHDICFEWVVFGLKPEDQPRLTLFEESDKLQHPADCVLDIDATFEMLRFRLIHNSLYINAKNQALKKQLHQQPLRME